MFGVWKKLSFNARRYTLPATTTQRGTMKTRDEYWLERNRLRHLCDKCNQLVPISNSALAVDELATGRFAGAVKDRHLFPTDNCEGSPSRIRLVQSDPIWKAAYERLKYL